MPSRHHRTALPALTVALAAGLMACTGDPADDQPAGPAAGGTLVYYSTSPLDTLDPHRLYVGRDSLNLGRTVYRSLVSSPAWEDPAAATTPMPDLATDTGTSTDGGRKWSFRIKDGVTWEDGRPISCEDFRYGASRVFATDVITQGPTYLLSYLDIPVDPSTGLPAYTGPYTRKGQDLFDEAVTCDAGTITYRFKRPWPDFPHAIAALHLADPYRRDKDRGARSKFQIFSNGPYRLDGRWHKETGGALIRNDSYQAATDSPRLRRALPDRIEFQIGQTAEVEYDRLIADRGIDRYAVTSDTAPPSKYREIQGSAAPRSVHVASPYVMYVAPHFRSPGMKNPVVRRAFSLSANAEGCVSALGGELGASVAESVVHPGVLGYRPNPAFDGPDAGAPDRARRMLADAGMRLPIPVKLSYAASATSDNCAAALKETWDRAGFAVTLDPLGWGGLGEVTENPDKDSDALILFWDADWPSAITVTPPLFDSRINLTSTSDGQNGGAYDSDAFNALVDEAMDAADLDAQTDALQRADLQLGADVAYIPVAVVRFVLLRGSKVTTYVVSPSVGSPDLGVIGVSD